MKKQNIENIKIIKITLPSVGIVVLKQEKGVRYVNSHYDLKKKELIVFQDKK